MSTAAAKLITALDPELARREADERARREAEKPTWVPAVSPTSARSWPREHDERKVATSPTASTPSDNTPARSRQLGPEAETDQHTQAKTATKIPTPQQAHEAAEEQAWRKPHGWTAPSRWLDKLLQRRYENHAQQNTEGQSVSNTQVGGHRDLLDSWGLGQLNRRQIALAAALALISLIIVLVVVSTRDVPIGGPTTGDVSIRSTEQAAYVYQSPSLAATKVAELPNHAQIVIQCTSKGDKVGASDLWVRVGDGYIPEINIYTSTDLATVRNC